MNYDTVLLISCDTLRADAVAANPNKIWPYQYSISENPDTPTLDTFAKSSAHFLEARTAAPYTSASHGSIFSGKWPVETGLHEYLNGSLKSKTLFDMAHNMGYRTIFKTDFPFVLGEYLGFTRSIDNYVVEANQEVLPLLAEDTPTFMFYHFADVHLPYGYSSYADTNQDLKETADLLEAKYDLRTLPQVDRFVETFVQDEELNTVMRYKAVIEALYVNQQYDTLFGLYLDGIQRFDTGHLQRFFANIAKQTKGKRVLTVLFGDHGEDYSSESYGHYNSVTEGALRVPLIFNAPDIDAIQLSEPVRTVDIAPTVADLMGGQLDGFSGRSLVPSMRGQEQVAETAFAQTYTANSADLLHVQEHLLQRGESSIDVPHHLTCECMYHDNWKLVRRHLSYRRQHDSAELGVTPDHSTQLFRRSSYGTYEINDNQKITENLVATLDSYTRKLAPDEGNRKGIDPAMRRKMQALGYRI